MPLTVILVFVQFLRLALYNKPYCNFLRADARSGSSIKALLHRKEKVAAAVWVTAGLCAIGSVLRMFLSFIMCNQGFYNLYVLPFETSSKTKTGILKLTYIRNRQTLTLIFTGLQHTLPTLNAVSPIARRLGYVEYVPILTNSEQE